MQNQDSLFQLSVSGAAIESAPGDELGLVEKKGGRAESGRGGRCRLLFYDYFAECEIGV